MVVRVRSEWGVVSYPLTSPTAGQRAVWAKATWYAGEVVVSLTRGDLSFDLFSFPVSEEGEGAQAAAGDVAEVLANAISGVRMVYV